MMLFGPLHVHAANRSLMFSGSLIPPLLGYLALNAPAGRAVPRTLVAERLWPHLPGALARLRLNDTLYRLRQSLDTAPEWLEADHSNIRLTNISSDVAEFRVLAASDSLNDWKSAIEYYTGELLDGIDAEWLLVPRVALRDLYLTTLAKVCDALIKDAQFAEALAYAHRWMLADPLNETSYQVVMRLAAQLGRHAEALQTYDQLVELLEDEFQSTPLPETRALANSIRAAYYAPALPGVPPLLGREAERAALLGMLDRAHAGQGAIVLLEGAAGVGKSHLIDAFAEGARWRQARVIALEIEAAATQPFAPLEAILRQALAGVWGQVIHTQLAEEMALVFGQPHAQQGPGTVAIAVQFAQAAQALGDAQTHVFVLEGMHLAAPALWQLVHDCAAALRNSRTLLVLSYRGRELRANQAAWRAARALEREQSVARIPLGELPSDACEEIAQLAGAANDPAQLGALVLQSGGNPLLVQALAQAAPNEPLPPAARQWAEQQCALLATPALRLLEWLSILETQPALAVLNGLLDAAMLAQVPALLADGWLAEQHGALAFCAGVARDYIYTNLPPARRRAMHAQAARHLAWLGAPPEQYALHYEQAEHWNAASDAFGAAGTSALEQANPAQASQFYARALAAARRAGRDAAALEQLAATHAAALRQAAAESGAQQPAQIAVELARLDAPLGRPLAPRERVLVQWTIHAGADDTRFARMHGKIALRHARIVRLLAEAQAQGAAPTDRDLAQALQVSQRTIIADIALLRAQGIACTTRRRK